MAKRPTVASLKKVTAENLAALGAERLAEMLIAAADARPELKRVLRMELAAEQGAEHLLLEIDKRLDSIQSARTRVSWRKRADFVRDLDVLRELIAARLGAMDPATGLDRMWRFMALARPLAGRVRDRDGELEAVFVRGAEALGALTPGVAPEIAAGGLAEALVESPARWAEWLGPALAGADPALARDVMVVLSARSGAVAGWLPLLRLLADAAGDADAYASTFSATDLKDPAAAAEVAQRLLAADRVDEAGAVLKAAKTEAPKPRGWIAGKSRPVEPHFDWESAWIDYLDRSGQQEAAQAARWTSFERTLSVDRARAFTRRLDDFDDVEAEEKAFALAAAHPEFERGLRFLMDWPAFPAAGRMILDRASEATASVEDAELWAARLRARQPQAAEYLLRKVAAEAFKRREFKVAERLTQEADAITPG